MCHCSMVHHFFYGRNPVQTKIPPVSLCLDKDFQIPSTSKGNFTSPVRNFTVHAVNFGSVLLEFSVSEKIR